jgi:2-hydroxychromene-2-carboxylate isomerase
MSKRMTFYYDIVCPYAYLAAERISRLPQATRERIDWQPVHLGGLLTLTRGETNPMNVMSASRLRMNALDLTRWAQRLDLPLSMVDSHPMRTTDAVRHLSVLEGEERERVSRAYFRGYWSSGSAEHWGQVNALAAEELRDSGTHERASAVLRTNTQRAFDTGACGVPTFVVGDDVFWGQDRLFQALSALTDTAVSEDVSLDRFSSAGPPIGVDFYHDFSSPFSYLASTQIRGLCSRWGAGFTPKPILLGALFKSIGTADVPLLTFSKAKQAYMAKDLERWAEKWGVPFEFPTSFPIRTVTPLRLAIVEPALTESLYRWAWAENHNIGDEAILRGLLTAEGHDADALLARTQDPEIKTALRNNTNGAQEAGICGVPSFVVKFPYGNQLVWGQDRLSFVEWMLKGWFPSSMENR